jgi:hypothetical protein
MPPADTVAPAPAMIRDRTLRERLAAVPWPLLALVALSVATFVGFLVYPTYPNYDSYYSMLWGREILHGHLPSFDGYKTPTEHPLAVAFGGLLSLLGRDGDRVMVFCTEASYVVLCAGIYRVGRAAFTPLVGLAAGAILCTRFDFPFLAARAYIDIPYLAFVIWAVALEIERPRRGGIVWLLLACAGLLRPEAWILIGLYFLWVAAGVPASRRVALWPRYAAFAAIGPLVWVAVDFVATGHPLFSLQHTSGLAEELGRTKGISEVPASMQRFFQNLAKTPVLYAAGLGFVAALLIAPRRTLMPAVMWLIGSGTFVLVGLAGLSVIDRYLLVPTLMCMLFAAVAIGGWTMLRRGTPLRRVWAVLAAGLVLYGVVYSVTRVNLRVFEAQLQLRGRSHASLIDLLDNPKVRDAVDRCGPLSTPNHKLVPDSRWLLGASASQVIARSDPAQGQRKQRGVALYVVERSALLAQALVDDTDDPMNGVPMAGFRPVAFTHYCSAFATC